jgi:hypothetical protein
MLESVRQFVDLRKRRRRIPPLLPQIRRPISAMSEIINRMEDCDTCEKCVSNRGWVVFEILDCWIDDLLDVTLKIFHFVSFDYAISDAGAARRADRKGAAQFPKEAAGGKASDRKN